MLQTMMILATGSLALLFPPGQTTTATLDYTAPAGENYDVAEQFRVEHAVATGSSAHG